MNLLDGIWDESDEFNINDFKRIVKNHEDFVILQLTDTHIGSYIMDDFDAVNRTFDMITEAVYANNPDMLILTGDNVIATGVINTLWAERLIVLLDSFKIPYALIMGNHDGGGFFDVKNDNRQQITADIFASGKYTLFSKGPENIGGTGNYGVNITDENNNVLYSLIMLDSNRDYLREKQVAWYEWYIKGINKAVYGTYNPPSGKIVKSMVFFHIPLPEIVDIKKELTLYDPILAADYFGESPCPQSKNTGMFQKIKQLESTTHIFFGHDHENTLYYEYQNIYWIYGLKTGYCAYPDNGKIGVTLITVSNDGKTAVEFKYMN
jgi:Icc-related predicted phosphoesterase